MGFDCFVCKEREIWAWESDIPYMCTCCFNILNNNKKITNIMSVPIPNLADIVKKEKANEARKLNLEKARAARLAAKQIIDEKAEEVLKNKISEDVINKMFRPLKEEDLPKQQQVSVQIDPIINVPKQPAQTTPPTAIVEAEEEDDDDDEDQSSNSGFFFKLMLSILASFASVLLPGIITNLGDYIVSRKNNYYNNNDTTTNQDDTQTVDVNKNNEGVSFTAGDVNSAVYNGVSIYRR